MFCIYFAVSLFSLLLLLFFFLLRRRRPRSTLFPYTTLFRSNAAFRAMGDLDTGITYVNAPTIGAEAHLPFGGVRSEEHTSELQSLTNLVCRLLLEKKKDVQETATTLQIDKLIYIGQVRVSHA